MRRPDQAAEAGSSLATGPRGVLRAPKLGAVANATPSLFELIERGTAEIGLEELRTALAASGDEDDSWEAKGTNLRTEHIYRSVAGLANASGGLLLLGVSRRGEEWVLDGVEVSGEPGPWIEQAIRDNLRPTPQYRLRIHPLPQGRFLAVVRVDRMAEHLVVTSDGKVFRRQHGRTAVVPDGLELTRLVQERATSPGRVLDLDLASTELAAAVTATVRDGHAESLRPVIAGLQARLVRAAEHEPTDVLDREADKLASLCGALVSSAAPETLTRFALEAHHRAFDEGVRFHPIPTARPDLDLFRVVLRNVRALGGLLVRLEKWTELRSLAAHRATQNEDVYPGWFSYIGSMQARVRGRPANAEVLRWPLREARDTAMRLGSLRPDGADEHQVLPSVLNFEMLASLIEFDQGARLGFLPEVCFDFAAFDADCQRPLVARIAAEEPLRTVLLPESTGPQVALDIFNLDGLARQRAAAIGERWDGIIDSLTTKRLQSAAAA